ncbi:GNAT family N-acetyltransferase [Microbacterium sp.]|uniref:GNAT family N-acetyltransferase n=1 Tax=Microbacterium sp. TaxID=51671 RepID=UPI0039E54E89
MTTSSAPFAVRVYHPADERSWLRCRVLSFLDTQYYDDVRPRRVDLVEPAIALVAVAPSAEVIGILDIEIDGDAATIDTVAVHPDHQHLGIATALLDAALPQLGARGATTLDAWTREDIAANRWYLGNGFVENFRYPHVYLSDGDDDRGFQTPDGLSTPVTAYLHGRIDDEAELRARYRRVYICRQYIRSVSGTVTAPSRPRDAPNAG